MSSVDNGDERVKYKMKNNIFNLPFFFGLGWGNQPKTRSP